MREVEASSVKAVKSEGDWTKVEQEEGRKENFQSSAEASAEVSGAEEEHREKQGEEGDRKEANAEVSGEDENEGEESDEGESLKAEEEEEDEEGEVLKGDDSNEENSEESFERNSEPSAESSGDEQEGNDGIPTGETMVPESIPVEDLESVCAEETHEESQVNPKQHRQGSPEEATAEPAQEQPQEQPPEEILAEESATPVEQEYPAEPESTLVTTIEIPATTTIGTDLTSPTQDLLSMQSSIDNMDMSIIEHPTPSEIPGSPVVVVPEGQEVVEREFPALPSQQEHGHEPEQGEEGLGVESGGDEVEAAVAATEAPTETSDTVVENKSSEERSRKQVEEGGEGQTTSLDASYADVAAAAAAGTALGLGAAGSGRSLSDRLTPPPPPPSAEATPLVVTEEEVSPEATAAPPPPMVEDDNPEAIQSETTIIPEAAPELEGAAGEPTRSEPAEPDTESSQKQPQPQSSLDSTDSDNTHGEDKDSGISDSGILVPSHMAEETQPGTPNGDLGESVVLVSHPGQPSNTSSSLPHDGPSDTTITPTTSSIPDFGITSLPSLISNPEGEAEHLAETVSNSALDSESDSLDDSESSDSEDEAEREWRESLKELELLASMVLVPFLGKWVGRRCAYWAWTKFMTWKYPVNAIQSTTAAFEIVQAAKAAMGTINES